MKPEITQNPDGKLELNRYYLLKKIESIEDLLRVINSMELGYTSSTIKKHKLEDLFYMDDIEISDQNK